MANLAISPVQPFIMLWGSLAIIIGVAGLSFIAQVLLWIPWLSLVWTVFMVRWTASLPGGSLEITEYNSFALALTYGMIGLITWQQALRERLRSWLLWAQFNWRQRILGPATVGALGVGSLLIWLVATSQPDGLLHVHFLDIGQGDGILIQTPSGRQVLVDGGASPQALFSELGAVLPFWDRSIDMLLLSHPDGDHMYAQVEVPARFQIQYALDTEISQENADAAPWRTSVTNKGAIIEIQHAGGWIDLGDGVALWVLWPPRGGLQTDDVDNENSLIVKLVYGNFSALLTGDAGIPSEEVLLKNKAPLESTILKVGHHGSTTSSSPAFIQAVDPLLAVIQVGENKYGHPKGEVLFNLKGREILRNDLHGRVHVYSDGAQMWADTEK